MGKKLLEAGSEFKIPTICGGIFPTSAPDLLFEHPDVKMIAMHEGERTFTDLVEAFKSGKSFTEVKSVWWKDDNNVIHKNPFPGVV